MDCLQRCTRFKFFYTLVIFYITTSIGRLVPPLMTNIRQKYKRKRQDRKINLNMGWTVYQDVHVFNSLKNKK